jgi:uncharacterized UBP type Zn finger protein
LANSGHYYTYVVDPSSPRVENGPPEKWIKVNDTVVSEVTDISCLEDITSNGVVFMYDKVEEA